MESQQQPIRATPHPPPQARDSTAIALPFLSFLAIAALVTLSLSLSPIIAIPSLCSGFSFLYNRQCVYVCSCFHALAFSIISLAIVI